MIVNVDFDLIVNADFELHVYLPARALVVKDYTRSSVPARAGGPLERVGDPLWSYNLRMLITCSYGVQIACFWYRWKALK
jgi:hypothetical protein